MILDVLENARKYVSLHKGFKGAFEFLFRPELKQLAIGRYEIRDGSIFAIVSKEPGRRKEDAQLETHEKYIDIQLVLDGTDEMEWKPKRSCTQPSTEYDPEDDIQLFADAPDAWISTRSGSFVIFFPEDAHAPLVSSGSLHKVVVKIAV